MEPIHIIGMDMYLILVPLWGIFIMLILCFIEWVGKTLKVKNPLNPENGKQLLY